MKTWIVARKSIVVATSVCALWFLARAAAVEAVLLSEPQTNGPPQAGSSERPQRERRLTPEDAFRLALGQLKGHVNLLEPKGVITVHRSDGAWLLEMERYSDLPQNSLSIIVEDGGNVTLHQPRAHSTTDGWPGSKPGGKDYTGKKIRPEVAFRKGIQALIEWRVHDEALFDARGKITFSRGRTGEWWFMCVAGYSGMRMEGYFITVDDNGNVNVKPAI